MGWTITHRAKGTTNDEWFARELGEGRTIVASSTIKGAYYAAVREDETGEVWGLVALVRWAPRSAYNFGWKPMDETMGPYYTDAPAKVLDALTETEHEGALGWRKACRSRLADKASTPKVKKGDKIRFGRVLNFGDGVSEQEFELVTRSTFRRVTDGRIVRIPSWKTAYTWSAA